MAKVEKKVVETDFPELDKEDTAGESVKKLEFRTLLAKYKKDKPDSYERNREEYERILNKFNKFPDMDMNAIGWTSYEDNKTLG